MAECVDINGSLINYVIEKDDGTVHGFYSDTPISATTGPNYSDNIGAPLGPECCATFGYTFDQTICKCLWKTSCDSNYLKLVLNSNLNGGEVFSINTDDICVLDVQFDYLLEFDSRNFIGLPNYLDVFNGLNIKATIEVNTLKEIKPDVVYETPYTVNTVYETTILDITDFGDYLSGNTQTGIRLIGQNSGTTINGIINELGDKGGGVSGSTFNSCWITKSFTISDQETLNLISNKKVSLGVSISGIDLDFSILFDKIIMNRDCDSLKKTSKRILQCPGFNLQRIIDNRKSWDYTEESSLREYELGQRETNYIVSNSNLIINTKEIDLQVDPSLAIEENIKSYIESNEESILSGDTVNFNNLLTTPLSSVTSTDEFTKLLNSEFIDVKNRQTIQSYPTLRFLYDKYLSPIEYGSPDSNKYKYSDLIKYSKSLGTYWVDIIEQLIPATTIWGSSYVYRNNIFDNNKFNYRKYTLLTCDEPTEFDYGTPIASGSTIEVKYSNISPGNSDSPITCTGVYLTEINSNPEFKGSVTVIGVNPTNNNDNILISD